MDRPGFDPTITDEYPSSGMGRVLIPIADMEQRLREAEAYAFVDELSASCEPAVVRYDPEPHPMRKRAEAISFYNGSGTPAMRAWYGRRSSTA